MELVATVVHCRQIGMDEYHDYRTSKVFPFTATIQEIDDWTKTQGLSIIAVKISFTESTI